jgi:Domain of unknown function (DUF4296)
MFIPGKQTGHKGTTLNVQNIVFVFFGLPSIEYKNHSHLCRISIMRYFFLLISFMFFACHREKEQPTVSDDKLANIMAEIAIADAGTTMLSSFKKDSLANAYYRQVFEMNGVTLEAYEKNLRLIVNDIPHLESIVKKAETIISEKKGAVSGGADKPSN